MTSKLNESLDKAKLLDLMQSEYAFALRTLALLKPEQMLIAGADGYWTPKDIVGHWARWLDRLPLWLENLRAGTYVPEIDPGWPWDRIDELNERNIQQDKNRPLDEVMAHFKSSHEKVYALIASMSEEDLFDNLYGGAVRRPFYHSVIGDTYGHYEEHLTPMRKWISAQGFGSRNS